jgi:pyruvate-formate lyase/deferrochelatase/peroxidase EfeB
MLEPKQAEKLSGSRKVIATQRDLSGPDEKELAIRYAQLGMPFVSEHSSYLTIHLKSPEALNFTDFKKIVLDLNNSSKEQAYSWVIVSGVSFDQWIYWSKENSFTILDQLFNGRDELEKVLTKNTPPYALDGGEVFFQIQAHEKGKTEEITNMILSELSEAINPDKTNFTFGDSQHGGRIYGGRMLHGLISSVNPVGFSARAIIGDELPPHKGGCFCLTQRFIHDWQQLLGMSDNELENLIGRNHAGNIILNDDERSHVKLVRVQDEDGLNYRLIGQSQPFRSENSRLGKEDGVYQISYAKNILAFTRILQNMIGDQEGYIKCRHLNISHADIGNIWYIPSAKELDLQPSQSTITVLMNEFFNIRSENEILFYNTKDYLYQVGNRKIKFDPPVTDRVVELLGYTFSRWLDTWYKRRPAPELGHLKDYTGMEEDVLLKTSIPERKGLAVKKALELLSSDKEGKEFDTYRLHPKELIVGVVPDYTLGGGYEVIRFLVGDEVTNAFLMRLNEGGAAGHNVPGYKRLLDIGVGGLLKEVSGLLLKASGNEAKIFYQSVIYALEGIQIYLKNYAELSRKTLSEMEFGSKKDRENLRAIAARMEKLSAEPPKSFIEAAQLIFSMHCCMHIAGESVSIGRLDQLLAPFYENDNIEMNKAQEIIDCFWIKMDEKVLLNHRYFSDRYTRGSLAITYAGGDFPQGAAINQWVQQVTVGGYVANDTKTPQDACNDVTRMCLRAARRLPLNAPCLSLRVHEKTPDDVIEETSKTLLSGGAHPLLINDDKIIAGLLRSGEVTNGSGTIVDLADARDMVCDGCFEALMAGKNEFAFSYVPVPDAIEMTLNRGNTYAAAGPVHLTGLKASFRSKPAYEIKDWDEFYKIFLEHYRYKLIDFYSGMLSRYGNLSNICPSPLLSSFVEGCLERGCDMTSGGAKYKLLAPLMNGIVTAIDSLYAIKSMVFSDEAVFTLPEIHNCLINDWGHDMKEPFYSTSIGADRIVVEAERFKHLRMYALGLPKFGQGKKEVDSLGHKLITDIIEMAHDVIRNPSQPIMEKMNHLRKKYGTEEFPFDFIITPGIATFEDYAGVGSFLGASANGRRNGQSVPSDCSPSSWPCDLPVPEIGRPALASLKSWAKTELNEKDPIHNDPIGIGLSNGSPVDINIRENFPKDQLVDLVRMFAKGEIGSNMLTISCADPKTLLEAQKFPERYDLIRMRMGGWSEFFVAMFPHHQEQHKRRPIFESKNDPNEESAEIQTAWLGLARKGK